MLYSRKRLDGLLCLDDFDAAARRYLPGFMYAYIAGGVETNASLRHNRTVFGELGFVPRVMRDVSQVDIKTTLWGDTYEAPFGIAPMGISAISAYRGDEVLARAAQRSGVPMIMSGSSLIRLEDITGIGRNVWFQAYLPGTQEQIDALVARASDAGFEKLVITVDTPVAANRENNVRAGFSTPLQPSLRLFLDGMLHPRWTFGTLFKTLARHGMPHFENNYATRGAPIISRNVLRDFSDRAHLNWGHMRRIRDAWQGKLIVKGILNSEDARRAVDEGVDGIIVSNHGGRQLDGSIAPLLALPEIVRACPQVPVMMDSGIRRGSDVMKALGLGARFVFVGRPFGFAAAVGGEPGVSRAIDLLATEVRRNCAMLGLTGVSDMGRSYLRTLTPATHFERFLSDPE
jgi:L-lactate dehydrogenase (cytochrome)